MLREGGALRKSPEFREGPVVEALSGLWRRRVVRVRHMKKAARAASLLLLLLLLLVTGWEEV